jgi:hypothetical protein
VAQGTPVALRLPESAHDLVATREDKEITARLGNVFWWYYFPVLALNYF